MPSSGEPVVRDPPSGPVSIERERTGTRSKRRVLVCAAIALCFWIRSWHFPDASASPVLDPSFMQGLGHALLHHLQFGTEIVYTYGPLGWFNAAPHQPELDWVAFWAFELALKLAIAVFFGLAALELRSWGALLAFAVFLIVPTMGNDAYFFLAIAAIAAWTIPRAASRPMVLFLPLALLVVIALDKYTYTLLALVVVACIAIASGGLRSAVRIAVMFALMFVVAWWALGQAPSNLPAWFATSMRLTAAYGTVQSVAPVPSLLALAVIVIALGLATVSCTWIGARRSVHGEKRAIGLMCIAWSAGLVLAYKAGFTRAFGSETGLFVYVAVGVFLLPTPSASADVLRVKATRAATCMLAVVGFGAAANRYGEPPSSLLPDMSRRIAHNLVTVFAFRDHEAMRDRERAELASRFALPHTRALVGDESIDVFGSEQAYVFLNELNWHPRPVFQAFCVMTDAFSAANARFLAGPDAPTFLLFLPDSIDHRLPGMEDARSVETMLRDYRVVGRERGMLLFERRPDAPRELERELVLERQLQPGETLDLTGIAGDVLELEVDTHLDLAGRLRTLALGGPVLSLETTSTDGVLITYRVLPSMMEHGAIIRPCLRNPGDWLDFLTGHPVHGVANVRFPADTVGWHTPFVVRVWRADGLRPKPDASIDVQLRWSMFEPVPDRFDSPRSADPTLLRGPLDALVVQAPSALTWLLAPGIHRLHAQYGFWRRAWREGETDGAIVRVELHHSSGARDILFERKLDPRRDPLDGELMTLDLDVRIEAGDEVSLATDPGPAGDTRRDLTLWTDVSFARER